MVFHNNNSIFCEILPSLPSRERGLKSMDKNDHHLHQRSLPSRERGLKCNKSVSGVVGLVSLPSRERGLKLWNVLNLSYVRRVAPFAGAWIEMQEQVLYTPYLAVAPFAGAWIEIP